MSIRTSPRSIRGRLAGVPTPSQVMAFLVMAYFQVITRVTYGALTHPFHGLTSRAKATAYVDTTYTHDTTTIRGRVARESMVWTVMSVGIALVITLFVVGILDANLPATGNSEFDNATDNTTAALAGNIEDLGPLLVLLILLAAAIVYVFIIRDQA